MSTDTKRRLFLKGTLASSVVALAAGAGQAQQLAADQTKVTQMGQTVQPIGTAPDSPAPANAQTVNDQLADGIIPDDPVIP